MTTFGAIFLIVLFIGLFILALYSFHDFDIDWRSNWWIHLLLTPVYAIMAGLCELLILIIMILAVYPDKVPDTTYEKDIPIYSIGLNNDEEVSGSFVLGCGSFSGEMIPTYRYYEKDENGAFHLNEVNAKNFVIVMTDDVVPHIHVNATKCKMVPKRCKWMFVETVHSNLKQEKWEGTIYLPSNAIVQSYQIKL